MDKNQVLAFIKQKLADGTVTSADVASLAPAAAAASPLGSQAPAGDRHSLVAKVLYALGALIVIIGAGILVADNWNTLGSGGRIFVAVAFHEPAHDATLPAQAVAALIAAAFFGFAAVRSKLPVPVLGFAGAAT